MATDIADTGAHSEILQVVVQCLRETIQQRLVWADQNKWPWSPQSRSGLMTKYPIVTEILGEPLI